MWAFPESPFATSRAAKSTTAGEFQWSFLDLRMRRAQNPRRTCPDLKLVMNSQKNASGPCDIDAENGVLGNVESSSKKSDPGLFSFGSCFSGGHRPEERADGTLHGRSRMACFAGRFCFWPGLRRLRGFAQPRFRVSPRGKFLGGGQVPSHSLARDSLFRRSHRQVAGFLG